MTESRFHLPRAGYDALVRILHGYLSKGGDTEPVSPSDVAAEIEMQGSNVSANSKFLVSMGILENDRSPYRLTPDGVTLARALDFYADADTDESPDPSVRDAWRAVVAKSDFLNRVTTAVRVRGGMEAEAFARHVALTSGVPNKSYHLTGARTIVTILKKAGRLGEDKSSTLHYVEAERREPEDTVVSQREHSPETEIPADASCVPARAMPVVSLSINVEVTPNTTDDQLHALANKIRNLTRLIAVLNAEAPDDPQSS